MDYYQAVEDEQMPSRLAQFQDEVLRLATFNRMLSKLEEAGACEADFHCLAAALFGGSPLDYGDF